MTATLTATTNDGATVKSDGLADVRELVTRVVPYMAARA